MSKTQNNGDLDKLLNETIHIPSGVTTLNDLIKGGVIKAIKYYRIVETHNKKQGFTHPERKIKAMGLFFLKI